MSGVAKTVKYGTMGSDRHYDTAARTILAIAGVLFSLVGFVLTVGGYLSFNGSAFHILVGLGLIVSGALVARRHQAGAWTYMLVFAGTVTWSLRNVEAGSALPTRLIGPALVLAMIALLMPLLCRWQPRHVVAVFAGLITATVGLGISSLPNGRSRVPRRRSLNSSTRKPRES